VMGVTGAAVASTVAYGIALAVMLRYLWRLPVASDGAGNVAATQPTREP
jgi:Na+-driven multidrug efflux pump